MDTFRRAFLPGLVILILLAALVFRLSSCSTDTKTTAPSDGMTESAPVTASDSAPEPSPGAKSPKPPYSGAEIKTIYESLGLSVLEIRDAGDVTMVHYCKPTGVEGENISRFDWFDRLTGSRELVCGWVYTDRFEIKPDKSLTVLTTGLSPIDGIQSFPGIYKAGYEDIDGALRPTDREEKYFAPLDKSCSIGRDRHASVTDINVNPGFISFGFGPQAGYESEFFAAGAAVPKMDFTYMDGNLSITLYKTMLAKGAEMLSVKENSYAGVVAMRYDGGNTTLTLRVSDSVSRYNVSTETSPASGLPYAVLEFTNTSFDYPAGW